MSKKQPTKKPLPKPPVTVERELKVRINIKGTEIVLTESEAQTLYDRLDTILDNF